MAIEAKRLNRRATIERQIDTPDGAGGQTREWVAIGAEMVEAIPIGGKEALTAGTLKAAQPYKVAMRYRAGIDETCRLVPDWLPGRVLTIQSAVDPTGQRRELSLLCEAVPI